jgi:hypothetical protein
MAKRFYNGMGAHLKKEMRGFPHVFRKPLRPIPNLTTCPSSPAAEEPISVAILSNLPRKKKSNDVNVSNIRERGRQSGEKDIYPSCLC